MTNIKKPRRNTDYRNPQEIIVALKKAGKEMKVIELSWELKCDPQTIRNKLRELMAAGLITERCEGGKERPQRYYAVVVETPITNHIIEE